MAYICRESYCKHISVEVKISKKNSLTCMGLVYSNYHFIVCVHFVNERIACMYVPIMLNNILQCCNNIPTSVCIPFVFKYCKKQFDTRLTCFRILTMETKYWCISDPLDGLPVPPFDRGNVLTINVN